MTYPVVLDAQFAIAHVPDLVVHGSKPARELGRAGGEREALAASMRSAGRSWEQALGYPPHQVLLGNLEPEELAARPRPWFRDPVVGAAQGPHGVMVDQPAFYCWLRAADGFDLIWGDEEAALWSAGDGEAPQRAGSLVGAERVERGISEQGGLALRDGDVQVGCIVPAQEDDPSLSASVLLENLAAKASGALALRRLLARRAPGSPAVDYLLGCGEEAVGDRYQRGGGSLGKAMGELAGCVGAGGADVKAFCAGPLHALVVGGALVQAGVFERVAVVAGGSLAKLGMKFRGHLQSGYPVLEDVLVGMAVELGRDDGRSPQLRLDAVGRHAVGAPSAGVGVMRALVRDPLKKLGRSFTDIDHYSTELHDPDITEPAGSGNVPATNYRLIAALAVEAGDVKREQVDDFVSRRGLPGFSPTQGHIASAVPFLPHARARLLEGREQSCLFLAKGSLFLGRMTEMADGLSVLLERNPAAPAK